MITLVTKINSWISIAMSGCGIALIHLRMANRRTMMHWVSIHTKGSVRFMSGIIVLAIHILLAI